MAFFRRVGARYRSPAFKAIRLAGPPVGWLVVAGLVGLAAVVALYVAGVHDSMLLVAVPAVAFTVACLLDRDGWRIRTATGELAAMQRQRWTGGRLAADAMSAEAWLATHPDAPVLDRVTMLLTAGRFPEARQLVDGAVGRTPEEIVRLARMRLTVRAAMGDASLDDAAIEAFERLPELADVAAPERRYQRLSLAWSAAWLRIRDRRPWRSALAEDLRELGPFRPPVRYLVFHAIQQLAFPIAYGLAWLIIAWLGLADALR